eukprot:g15850.t1
MGGDKLQLDQRVFFLQQWINGKRPEEIGPLHDAQLDTYGKQLELVGTHKLRAKLQESKMAGGVNLELHDAALAVEQLLFRQGKGGADGVRGSILSADGLVKIVGGSMSHVEAEDAAQSEGGAAPAKGGAAAAKGGKDAKGGKGEKGAKGAGGVKTQIDPNLKKAGIIPPKPMKPLWWGKYNFGKQIKEGVTTWDEVEDLCPTLLAEDSATMLDFVERFAKTQTATKKEGDGAAKKAELKELIVVTDANLAVAKQKLCKVLPSPEILVAAIQEFDETVIDKELLEGIKMQCVPTPVELAAMEKLRAEHPDVPWALPEKYMWAVGHIPDYEVAYEKFSQSVDALASAHSFRELLAVALAAGNFLNGNTNRGQADGFDLANLPLFATVKDNLNDKLKVSDWIFGQFLKTNARFEKVRAELMEQFGPVFTNVKRRIAKSKDGVASMSKQVKYANEDYDGLVKLLQDEFEKNNGDLQMILGFFEDPTDPIRTVLVPEFEAVKLRMDKLAQQKQAATDKLSVVQTKLNLGKMLSTDLFTLIDDFMIPGDLILNKPEAVQKKFMVPIFCGLAAPTLSGMLYLWNLEEPKEEKEERDGGEKKGKRKQRAQNRRGKREGKDAGGGAGGEGEEDSD